MKVARLVKKLVFNEKHVKEQNVYRMNPPLQGYEHVLFSSVILPKFREEDDNAIETMLFGCSKDGEVISWSEIYCDREDWDQERIIIMELGYTIDKLEDKFETVLNC